MVGFSHLTKNKQNCSRSNVFCKNIEKHVHSLNRTILSYWLKDKGILRVININTKYKLYAILQAKQREKTTFLE